MPHCYLALGGNSGSVGETFERCLDELNSTAGVSVVRVSRYFTTAAVGADAGGEFLNAAAELQTELPPLELLDLLQGLETRHGRTREKRWGPRTLDLDIVLYGDVVCNDPRLILPHPACWYRRFVLDPLEEIAASVVHPVKGITIAELRRRLLPRPLRLAICGGSREQRTAICEALRTEFPDAALYESHTAADSPALLAWLGTGDDDTCWEELPLLPRLDVSQLQGPATAALQAVLTSALG